MEEKDRRQNAEVLAAEIDWFQRLVHIRFELYFDGSSTFESLESIPPPDLKDATGAYAGFVKEHQLDVPDRILLLLALIPHLRPALLNHLFVEKPDRMHTLKFTRVGRSSVFHEFGGVPGSNFKGFLPTGLTYLFLVAGDDLSQRLDLSHRLANEHLFAKLGMIYLEPHYLGEPTLSGKLILTEPWVEFLTIGRTPESPASPKYYDTAQNESE